MAVTGEQVFEIAMKLMDEVNDNGSISEGDTLTYKGKSPSILTTLQTELLPNTQTPVIITDLTNDLLISDRIALLILPYGLAAHLMLTEDTSVASFFNSRYEEMRSKVPVTIETITDKHDVLSGLT